MSTFSRRFCFLLLTLLTMAICGCGGGGGTTAAGPSDGGGTPTTGGGTPTTGGGTSPPPASVVKNRVSQSPIINGTVFADRVVGGVSNFTLDADEVTTTTDADGYYTLPTPSYDYILVSKGGQDKVTGLDQILMLAPRGSANITPLTTLVTLDTTGDLAQKLMDLQDGAPIDGDVYTRSSPAALMLIKSVEISVQSLTETFMQKSGGSLSASQIYSIQARTMQKIAQALTNSPLDPAVPANLYSILITAFKTAIPAVKSENPNIVISTTAIAGIAVEIASSAVDASAKALNRTGCTDTNPLGTAPDTAESGIVSYAPAFKAALSKTVSALVAPTFTIAASATPLVYNPQTFPVISVPEVPPVITGSTGTPGGIGF